MPDITSSLTVIPFETGSPNLPTKSFRIQSNLGLPADQFDADLTSHTDFIGAKETDRISLSMGLRKSDGTEVTIGHIKDGVVDEYILKLTPNGLIVSVRGRDPMAVLLDRNVNKTYVRAATQGGFATRTNADASIKTLAPELAPVGRYRASEIAADVLAEVSSTLQLSWQVRDYEWRDGDFNASGRPLDILRQLADPWNQAEQSPVDVFVQGDSIIVLNRPPVPPADAGYRFHVRDARIKDFTWIRRPPRRLGRVILEGMLIQKVGTLGVATGEPSNPTLDIEERNIREVENSEEGIIRGPDGLIIATTSSTMRYRMPDGVLLFQVKSTHTQRGNGLDLTQRETVTNTWETVEYDQGGRPLKQPNQLSGQTTIEGIHPSDKSGTFQVLRTEDQGFDYDSDGYLKMTAVLKKELNLKSRLLEKRELVTRNYRDTGPGFVELTTSTFRFNSKANRFDAGQHEVVTNGGVRPGGPGRSKIIFIPKNANGNPNPGAPDTGMLVPVQLEKVISTDPKAVDFTYSNPNLTLEDLEVIMVQLEEGSSLWETELSFMAVSMPWLRRGSVIFLYGLEAADGTPIVLKPAVVVEVNTNYDESSATPSMLSQVRAVYWSS